MCVLWDRFESFLGFIHMYPSGLHSSEGLPWLMSLLSPELSFTMCGLRGECVLAELSFQCFGSFLCFGSLLCFGSFLCFGNFLCFGSFPCFGSFLCFGSSYVSAMFITFPSIHCLYTMSM